MEMQGLCDAVMRGVVASGVVTEANIGRAVEVMRAEVKALLTGDEYANERAVVMAGTMPESVVLTSVVASCVLKIGAADERAANGRDGQ